MHQASDQRQLPVSLAASRIKAQDAFCAAKKKEVLTNGGRLIDGVDGRKRGQVERGYIPLLSFGSSLPELRVSSALFNCASVFIIKAIR